MFVPDVKEVLFLSSDCAVQLKSCHVFQDTARLDTSITIEWNYFESHHGNGTADVIGGCVKQKVFKHVKSCNIVSSNVEQFADYAIDFVNGVDVIYYDIAKLSFILKVLSTTFLLVCF